jgi:anti-sigma factor RsiW
MQADLHQSDPHQAMRHIIDKSLVGEASPVEQQALRKHLLACAACQKYASDSRRAIVSLSGFSFAPFATDPGLQAKIHAALDTRAQQLHATQPSRRRIAQVSIAALLLTIVGSFGALHVGSPLGALLHLDPAAAQSGVVALWVLPSLFFSLLLPVVLLLSARSAKTKGSVL